MAWVTIPNNPNWEYENTDTNLGAVAGVRQFRTHQVYTKTRRVGSILNIF